MTFIDIIARRVIPAAYDLLPSEMASPAATRALVAIMWQESRGIHRVQIVDGGGRGPARGLWQFERLGGVRGVLTHPATKTHAAAALGVLGYNAGSTPHEVWANLEHNDILAAVFARLLLWSLPDALPTTAEEGWAQYRAGWRPGKPHPETWPTAWQIAHDTVR